MYTLSLPHAPDLVALAAAEPAHFPCLLQSAGSQGWDILAAFPEDVRVYGAGRYGGLAADLAALPVGDGWATGELPFRRLVFYLGYELLEQFEPSVPVGWRMIFRWAPCCACRRRFWSTAPAPAPGWWPSTANNWIG